VLRGGWQIKSFTPSDGGLTSSMAGFTNQKGTVWIGWPGIVDEDLAPGDKEKSVLS